MSFPALLMNRAGRGLVSRATSAESHARYVIFQMAEVAVPKRLFRAILERIRRPRMPEMVQVLVDRRDGDRIIGKAHDARGPQAIWEIPVKETEMHTKPIIRYALILIIVGAVLTAAPGDLRKWHTSPGKWEEARTYHTPFDKSDEKLIAGKLKVGKNLVPLPKDLAKTWSDNGAYWFAVEFDNGVERKDGSWSGPRKTIISIFNEGDHLSQIRLLDHAYRAKVRWINEKLLYVEVWWGRVFGTSLIYDVESEKIIYKETAHRGTVVFQQWEQWRKDNNKKRPAASSPTADGPG